MYGRCRREAWRGVEQEEPTAGENESSLTTDTTPKSAREKLRSQKKWKRNVKQRMPRRKRSGGEGGVGSGSHRFYIQRASQHGG